MKKMTLVNAGAMLAVMSLSANAYDGQNCSEPGVCWEPKPGYPEKVAGSKYDPKHDVNELNKQAQSVVEMKEQNFSGYLLTPPHLKNTYVFYKANEHRDTTYRLA
jgi:methanol dehydrogenase (cytochrome c) subunit 2